MNPDLTPSEFLTEFLLEQISKQPREQSVLLYRALAADTKDAALRAECRERAKELEAVMRKERQMLLTFRFRNS